MSHQKAKSALRYVQQSVELLAGPVITRPSCPQLEWSLRACSHFLHLSYQKLDILVISHLSTRQILLYNYGAVDQILLLLQFNSLRNLLYCLPARGI